MEYGRWRVEAQASLWRKGLVFKAQRKNALSVSCFAISLSREPSVVCKESKCRALWQGERAVGVWQGWSCWCSCASSRGRETAEGRRLYAGSRPCLRARSRGSGSAARRQQDEFKGSRGLRLRRSFLALRTDEALGCVAERARCRDGATG